MSRFLMSWDSSRGFGRTVTGYDLPREVGSLVRDWLHLWRVGRRPARYRGGEIGRSR